MVGQGALARSVAFAVALLAFGAFAACDRHSSPASPPTATPADRAASLEDRVAHELLDASPPADPADARARDVAGERLSQLRDLLDAAGERILWGGFDPRRGYEPPANPLTQFVPFVWAKMYLSTFMFAGPYEVRQEGRFTVLEIAARFRDGLDSGDYPYPFWHSAQKWQSYVDTRSLIFVFDRDRLLATYRRPAADSGRVATRAWDSRWRWTDAQGHEGPRVALFTYVLSADNPWLADLERTYRSLESGFRSNNCVSCHAPDNPAKSNPLLLLDYPNQALVARHALVETLRGDKMPPPDPAAGRGAGLGDEAVRTQLLALAEAFEHEADAALAYERSRSMPPSGATSGAR